MNSSFAWLVARPVAHRGLHDSAAGVIENTATAVVAAVAAGYAVEVDLQLTRDGDAVVYHDDALGRLTDGGGRLATMTTSELKRVRYTAGAERILTLGELCDLLGGRAAVFLELKGRADRELRLARRVCQVLDRYNGPVAAMSFDPRQVRALGELQARVVCGLVAHARWRAPSYLYHVLRAAPRFMAYDVRALPAIMPTLARSLCGLPILAWTVRSQAEHERARRWADQIIFEDLRP